MESYKVSPNRFLTLLIHHSLAVLYPVYRITFAFYTNSLNARNESFEFFAAVALPRKMAILIAAQLRAHSNVSTMEL